MATVKALLSLGTSVSILPQVVRGPEDEGTLTYVKLSDAEPFREIGVIRHVQRYQSRGAEQFLTLLREWARELAGA